MCIIVLYVLLKALYIFTSLWLSEMLTVFISPLPTSFQKAAKQLLLNSLLGHTAVTTGTTGKPSMARQRIMEEERVRAVEAYRLLKKQRQQQFKDRDANLEKLRNPK